MFKISMAVNKGLYHNDFELAQKILGAVPDVTCVVVHRRLGYVDLWSQKPLNVENVDFLRAYEGFILADHIRVYVFSVDTEGKAIHHVERCLQFYLEDVLECIKWSGDLLHIEIDGSMMTGKVVTALKLCGLKLSSEAYSVETKSLPRFRRLT